MDEMDLRLIQLLVRNPRAPYRELADRLDISVQAVHRRIQLLMETHIIHGFSAAVSLSYLEAVPVMVYGRSSAFDRKDIIGELDKSDMVSSALFASGGIIYVYGLLRKIAELDRFVDQVKKATKVSDPVIGIETVPPLGAEPATKDTEPLSPVDMRIIASLARDGRRAATDIAQELGLTAATVNRRLERLFRIGAVEASILLHPGFSGDIVAIVQVKLREGVDRQQAIARMRERFGPSIEYYRTYGNIPGFFTCVAWTRTLKDLEVLTDSMVADEGIASAIPDIVFTGWYHTTWREALVQKDTKDV